MRLTILTAAAILTMAGSAWAAPFAAAPHPPAEQPPPPPPANAAALAREQRLLALLQPPVRAWGAASGPRQTGADALAAAKSTVMRRYPDLFTPADVDALAFLVLMAASHDAEADVRRVMDQIQAQNRSTAALTQAHGSKDAKSAKPPRSGLSPQDQIRLQPYQDRQEHLDQAAAALMATAEPNAAVLGNLK